MPHHRILEVLDGPTFSKDDLAELLDIFQTDPTAAARFGNHRRSTIWICCQHSDCRYRRAVLPPLLVEHGADVNAEAGNGNTPLLSLFSAHCRSSQDMEHKRQMAMILVHECGAMLPYENAHGSPVDIRAWLIKSPMNLQLLPDK